MAANRGAFSKEALAAQNVITTFCERISQLHVAANMHDLQRIYCQYIGSQSELSFFIKNFA